MVFKHSCLLLCMLLSSLFVHAPLAGALCEALFWTYRQNGGDFAIATEEWKRAPKAFLDGYPKGKLHTASPHYSPGVRFTEETCLMRSPLFFDTQITYVPFKDQTIAQGPFLASLTLPTAVAGGFPAERIHSHRSLKYLLSDFLLRCDRLNACGLQWGAYGGVRCMAIIQKWTLLHSLTRNKGPCKVEWNMKMGNIGGTLGLRTGYQCSSYLACLLQVGGSCLKGIRGWSSLSWNFNTALSNSDYTPRFSPSDRWVYGWNATFQGVLCLAYSPRIQLTIGYDIQQWFDILQRDHYDFVSWECEQKRSTLTLHGASVGLVFCF